MKKIIICTVMGILLLSLCACNKTDVNIIKSSDSKINESKIQESKIEETVDIPEKEIALNIGTKNDYNKLALSFNDLVKDADFILKIKVKDIKPFINKQGMIQSEITPIVQEIYKGTYNSEKLYVNGGEMLYDDFIQNEVIEKQLEGHRNPNGEEENKGKYVRQNVDDQYIFNIGDEYVFFAKNLDEKYFSLYAYQGTFKISNGMVENSALTYDEPLSKDIIKIFRMQSENSSNSKSNSQTFSVDETNKLTGKISEKIFAKKINEINK